jgi:hypothetical protein
MTTEKPKRGPGRPRKDPDEVVDPVPIRGVRIPGKRWDNLKKATEAAGTDRSKVINDWAAWYTHEDGAKRPNRPTDEDGTGDEG